MTSISGEASFTEKTELSERARALEIQLSISRYCVMVSNGDLRAAARNCQIDKFLGHKLPIRTLAVHMKVNNQDRVQSQKLNDTPA